MFLIDKVKGYMDYYRKVSNIIERTNIAMGKKKSYKLVNFLTTIDKKEVQNEN